MSNSFVERVEELCLSLTPGGLRNISDDNQFRVWNHLKLNYVKYNMVIFT